MSVWSPSLVGPTRGTQIPPQRAYVFASVHVSSSGVLRNPFNVSAVSVLGTGLLSLTFSRPATDANYTVIGQARNAGGAYVANVLTVASTTAPTANGFVVQRLNGDVSGATDDPFDVIVFASGVV